VRHVGDCGNIVVEEGGNVTYLTLQSNLIKLSGETSVIGRAYVLHADEDDLGRGGYSDSKTTGHAGARVACGTIGLSGPFEHWF
jgi:Cu-Zn family superoxide dismutase